MVGKVSAKVNNLKLNNFRMEEEPYEGGDCMDCGGDQPEKGMKYERSAVWIEAKSSAGCIGLRTWGRKGPRPV